MNHKHTGARTLIVIMHKDATYLKAKVKEKGIVHLVMHNARGGPALRE